MRAIEKAARIASAALISCAAIQLVGCERAIVGEPIADPHPVPIVITFSDSCRISHVYLPSGGEVRIAPKEDWTPNRCVVLSVEAG